MRWLKIKVYHRTGFAIIIQSFPSVLCVIICWFWYNFMLFTGGLGLFTDSFIVVESGKSPSVTIQLSNSLFSIMASCCIMKCTIWSPSSSGRELSTSCFLPAPKMIIGVKHSPSDSERLVSSSLPLDSLPYYWNQWLKICKTSEAV